MIARLLQSADIGGKVAHSTAVALAERTAILDYLYRNAMGDNEVLAHADAISRGDHLKRLKTPSEPTPEGLPLGWLIETLDALRGGGASLHDRVTLSVAGVPGPLVFVHHRDGDLTLADRDLEIDAPAPVPRGSTEYEVASHLLDEAAAHLSSLDGGVDEERVLVSRALLHPLVREAITLKVIVLLRALKDKP